MTTTIMTSRESAAIHGLMVVTCNIADFEPMDVVVLNPGPPPDVLAWVSIAQAWRLKEHDRNNRTSRLPPHDYRRADLLADAQQSSDS